jgi:hypothetical protein
MGIEIEPTDFTVNAVAVLLMGNAIEPFHDHRNGATL